MSRSLRAWSAAALSSLGLAVLISSTLWSQEAEPRPNASEQKILSALGGKTELEYVDQPLVDVVEHLKERHGIEIQFDEKALTDAGVGKDTPITRNVKGTTLASALDLMLGQLDLSYTIHDEVLLLTSKTAAEAMLSTKTYPVADLLVADASAVGGARNGDYQSLIELITSSIAPTTWNEVGGPGTIQASRVAEAIVISQTFRTHREIENLLTDLRTVRRAHVADQPKAAKEAVQDDQTFYVKVYRLSDAWFRSMAMLGGMGGVQSTNAQPPANQPADQEPPKAPKDVQPQFGGMGASPANCSHLTAEDLVKAIAAVIEPESWDISGGGGSIRAFDNRLLVRQTRPVHRQIEQLLREME